MTGLAHVSPVAASADWDDLAQRFGGGSLLNADLPFACVAQFTRGGIALVAVPECLGSGADLDSAARWVRAFNHRGVCALAPVLQGGGMAAALLGGKPWCLPLLLASRAVIVPRLAGWDRCPAVCWAARQALSVNVPVYLVSEHGGMYARERPGNRRRACQKLARRTGAAARPDAGGAGTDADRASAVVAR